MARSSQKERSEVNAENTYVTKASIRRSDKDVVVWPTFQLDRMAQGIKCKAQLLHRNPIDSKLPLRERYESKGADKSP